MSIPIATPEEAKKFIATLKRARLCPLCNLSFFPDCQCEFVPLALIPEANHKTKPWAYKGAMTLPRETELPVIPMNGLELGDNQREDDRLTSNNSCPAPSPAAQLNQKGQP